jgi:hypothetical protein
MKDIKMQQQVTIDQLKRAAKNNILTFERIPSLPIKIPCNYAIKESLASEVVYRYMKNGFAIIELEPGLEDSSPESVLAIGEALKLGNPFTPPLYLAGTYTGGAVSQITKQMDSKPTHPSFERTVGIALHCDGTLQEIGYVKTTIMFCKSKSLEGGDTILFNATAAFAELVNSDINAAMALASPGVLIRQANINGCSDINTGPAFSVLNGELICAYSLTETDNILATNSINENDLERGLEFMHNAAHENSLYILQFQLEEKQAIIFANSKICHGRTPYRDGEGKIRCMYRSLFLHQPMAKEEKLRQAI